MKNMVLITYDDPYGGCCCSSNVENLAICAEEDVDACKAELVKGRPYLTISNLDVDSYIHNYVPPKEKLREKANLRSRGRT